MSEIATPAATPRQPHYSFMRPGDFVWFVFFLIFTAWKFRMAFTIPDPYFTKWISYAIVSLLTLVWYACIRCRRRNCCADAGEVLITVLLPQAYQMALDYFSAENGAVWTVPFWMYVALLPVMAYQVWRAPKVAKKIADLQAAAEALRSAHDAPRFSHIENP